MHDFDPVQFHQQMVTHAAIGKAFDLPVVIATSAETGPNGPLPKAIRELHPNAPVIRRQGEINAWDSEAFRKAVKATGKKQIIIGGIVTDACTAFLALSLREAGYSVFANVEASGTSTALVRDITNDRMAAAGVQLMSSFAIFGELMRDWRATPGSAQILPVLAEYVPSFNYLIQSHAGAVENGTILPGEEGLN